MLAPGVVYIMERMTDVDGTGWGSTIKKFLEKSLLGRVDLEKFKLEAQF